MPTVHPFPRLWQSCYNHPVNESAGDRAASLLRFAPSVRAAQASNARFGLKLAPSHDARQQRTGGGAAKSFEDGAHQVAAARADLARGFGRWRLWLLLGVGDIRQRYQRSRVGQFWITISMLVTIVALGGVYGLLFRMSLQEYLPSLTLGIVAWALISSMVIEAFTVFTGAGIYLQQVPLPKSMFVHRMLVRNLVTFAHNMTIVPLLYLVFGILPGWPILLAPLGLAIVTLNGFWIGLLLGMLCARFRDMPQMIASLMQIAFFVTPVMWRQTSSSREVMAGRHQPARESPSPHPGSADRPCPDAVGLRDGDCPDRGWIQRHAPVLRLIPRTHRLLVVNAWRASSWTR